MQLIDSRTLHVMIYPMLDKLFFRLVQNTRHGFRLAVCHSVQRDIDYVESCKNFFLATFISHILGFEIMKLLLFLPQIFCAEIDLYT